MRLYGVTLVFLLLAGCWSPTRASLYGQPRALTGADYRDVLFTWTRSDRIYRGLDDKLFVTATFHSSEFRRAFAVAFPEIYGHGGLITKRELVDLTGDVEQYHNFFFAAYTPDGRWNQFDAQDSIWRWTLIGSEEVAVEAAEIVLVKVDANLAAVYPYLSRFDKAYLVRFPLTDVMKRMVLTPRSTKATLRVASALGVAEMVWDLIPGAEPTPSSEPLPPVAQPESPAPSPR